MQSRYLDDIWWFGVCVEAEFNLTPICKGLFCYFFLYCVSTHARALSSSRIVGVLFYTCLDRAMQSSARAFIGIATAVNTDSVIILALLGR